MVSVQEALQIIEACCHSLTPEKRPVEKSLHAVLAKEVLSLINMPPFRQSAMDGYAIHFSGSVTTYTLIGEVAAGSGEDFVLKPGEAVRIFTGAAVPDTADTVVQQEIVTRTANEITLTAEIKPGQNIRPLGEQIKKGEVALPAFSVLNAAATGYLATLGIETVDVFAQPKIGLLLTGNELVKPGTMLKHGEIYESNAVMLTTALQNYCFQQPISVKVGDALNETQEALKHLIAQQDVVLISGGISVGDYDFVKAALENLGVKEGFYKVKQKPGKPLFFGTLGSKLIFALPGNPASALTCFYMYVLPALNKLRGKPFAGLKKVIRKLNGSYQKKSGLAHFLKSDSDDVLVKILDGQSSAMLNTFALANGLIYVPAETEHLEAEISVDVYLF
jgi:molybdopterin molybdotransferase